MKRIELSTDGYCAGNPGPGGWACILQYGDFVPVASTGSLATPRRLREASSRLRVPLGQFESPTSGNNRRTLAEVLANGHNFVEGRNSFFRKRASGKRLPSWKSPSNQNAFVRFARVRSRRGRRLATM